MSPPLKKKIASTTCKVMFSKYRALFLRSRGLGLRWCGNLISDNFVVAVNPNHPEVQSLLGKLTGLDLNKVMARRKEPLVVPHYQLMTLEQLQNVSLRQAGPGLHVY